MQKGLIFVFLFAFFSLLGCAGKGVGLQSGADEVRKEQGKKVVEMQIDAYPDNKAGDVYDELWGVKVADPYRWLEDVKGEGVEAWVNAQDARTRKFLSGLSERSLIAADLEKLTRLESIGVPIVRGEKLFVFKRAAHDEKSILYLEEKGKERRALLDPLKINPEGSTSLGVISISPDGKLLAYGLKENNADHAVLYLMDVESGQTRKSDVIHGARYAHPSWLPDGSGFYYTKFPMDESIAVDKRPGLTEIYFHKVGSEESEDKLVLGALNDPTKFHQINVSEDGKWLIYRIDHGWSGNEIKIMKRDGGDKWVDLPVQKETHYEVVAVEDHLYILTNEGASRYKVMSVVLDEKLDLSRDKWVEVIAEDDKDVIEGFDVLGGKLVLVVIRDVANFLKVYERSGKLVEDVKLPSLGSLGSVSGRNADSKFYFAFQSFNVPPMIFSYDTVHGELKEWARIATSADVSSVITEQKWAVSKDGTKVPYFVVRKKDTVLDGSAHTILYGYGGFNVSITPFFRPGIYAWLERGGIYVYSNLRGGSEFGESWHRDGMRLKKQNVFDDYIAVAESLISEGYTSRKNLAIYGGSNGGLLVGAALTQRPELFGAVVCAVPLLDMVRYHLFGSGRTWISEYGSVDESEEYFKAIYAYSPYSQVKKGVDYPPVLFLGADSDDRVDPMHARKMTAILQDYSVHGNQILLRIEKNAGHGGADLVSQRNSQDADMYSFLLKVLGQ